MASKIFAESEDKNDWFRFAQNDYESAVFLTQKIPQPLEIICYLCQQSAEKALKALILHIGLKIEKTHDLLRLREIIGKNFDTSSIQTACAILTNYATVTRYPYSKNQIDEAQTKNAIQYAKKILDFAKQSINV